MNSMTNGPTIKDVAKEANVSVATVSRVLNGLPGFSADTEKKVQNAIAKLGYQYNVVARNLKMKKTNIIAVLLPRVETTFYVKILNGIEDAAQNSGYDVMLCHVGDSGSRTREYIKMLMERQVDGIIGCSLPPNEEIDTLMSNSKIPSVLVSTLSYDYTIPYIKIDDFKAEYAATEYLIKKGHRNIVFMSGPLTDVVAGVPRFNGYKRALKDNSIPFNEDLVAYTEFSFETGIKAFQQIVKRNRKFTAVVACCDDVAIASISVGLKNGLITPRDYSVIGFDNTRIAEMAIPPLTTISQPLYEMGTSAFKMLLEEIETGKKPKSIIVPYEIVERSSVAEI